MSLRPFRLIDLGTGESFDASTGIQVGRTLGSQTFPHYKNLSRAHFAIRVDGALTTIEDLGSANGTFLNDVKLTPKKRLPLKAGDRITAGNVKFVFQSRDAPVPDALGSEELTKIAEASCEVPAAPVLLEPMPASPAAAPTEDSGFDLGRLFVDFFERKEWHLSTQVFGLLGLLAVLATVATHAFQTPRGLPHPAWEVGLREFLAYLVPFVCGLFAHYVATRTRADTPVTIGLAALVIPAVGFAVGFLFVPLTSVDRFRIENGLYRTCFDEKTKKPETCLASVKFAIAKGVPISAEQAAKMKAFVQPPTAVTRTSAGTESSPSAAEIRGPTPVGGTPDLVTADLNYRTTRYLETLKEDQAAFAAFQAKVRDPGFCKMNWDCYVREVKKQPIAFATDAASIGALTIEYATRQKRSIRQCDAECAEKLSYDLYSAIADLAESIVVPNLFAYQDYTATSAGAQYIQLQEDAMLIKYFDNIRAHFEDRVATKMHIRSDLDFIKLAMRFERLGEFPKTHGLLAGRLSPMEIDQVFRSLPANPFRGKTEILETLRAYQAAHPVGAPVD